MRLEKDVIEGVVLECEDADVTVRACSCEMAAYLRRRPCYEVYGSGV